MYYGLTLIAGKFGGSAHISVAFSGLIEIPSYLLAPWLMQRFGRKRSLIGFMHLAGLCCACIVLLPQSELRAWNAAFPPKLKVRWSFGLQNGNPILLEDAVGERCC